MATTAPPDVGLHRDDGYFLFEGAGWDLYDRLGEWSAGERRRVKLVYIDGDVVVMAKSRRHNWFALRLHDIVGALSRATGVAYDDAGETTYRLREKEAGAEADQSYYLGENAGRMTGPRDFEPGVDPVPDLVIEVEVGNPVDRSLRAWARLGVPEVWHLDASRDDLRLSVLRLREDSTGDSPAVRSVYFPVSGEQVVSLLRPATTEATGEWREVLPERIAGLARD